MLFLGFCMQKGLTTAAYGTCYPLFQISNIFLIILVVPARQNLFVRALLNNIFQFLLYTLLIPCDMVLKYPTVIGTIFTLFIFPSRAVFYLNCLCPSIFSLHYPWRFWGQKRMQHHLYSICDACSPPKLHLFCYDLLLDLFGLRKSRGFC